MHAYGRLRLPLAPGASFSSLTKVAFSRKLFFKLVVSRLPRSRLFRSHWERFAKEPAVFELPHFGPWNFWRQHLDRGT